MTIVLAVLGVSALPAHADDPAKDKGVSGKVVVAPELATTAWPLSPERERALVTPALVRRPVRATTPVTELPGPLVVMLEGEGIREENPKAPTLVLEGMRFVPGTIVVARVLPVEVQNKQEGPVTFVDETGAEIGKAGPGETATLKLKTGMTLVRVKELPFATAAVRVLERGRVLPLKDGNIAMTAIPGGEYMLTFFLGSEPLRVQELVIPDQGLVYIDATVSQKGVVDVSIKDASMRTAVPVSVPAPTPTPKPPPGPPETP
jgi:hypothetical protein